MERQGAIYPDLAGKTVIVTGGGSGIGESITRGFARQGSRVGFIDMAEEPSRALAAELGDGVVYERADLTDVDALRRAIEAIRAALGPVDVLVNNAANDLRHRTEEVTSEFFDRMIAINLKQQFFCAQAVLPDMRAKRAGAIINFGSISWMQSKGGMAVYTAAKSAVLGLTRSLARDFGPDNIRVNAIAPGWIMTKKQIETWLTPEGEAEMMAGQCLKRRLMPDEVARFTVFLASDEASACTAQHYIVDGGWV
jgi:NAD(P)-dependent dehydrogenase (short-subunit alcohol dehydrogenase family)